MKHPRRVTLTDWWRRVGTYGSVVTFAFALAKQRPTRYSRYTCTGMAVRRLGASNIEYMPEIYRYMQYVRDSAHGPVRHSAGLRGQQAFVGVRKPAAAVG